MDSDSGRTGQAGALTRDQSRSSIKYSSGEGVSAAASEGATEEYYVPYVLAAGASASIVGWLIAFSQLALAFCYLKVPDYVRFIGSRKHAILVLVLFDVVTFLPFIFLPYLFKDHLVQTVFIFYVISIVPQIVVGPIWASWMTDLVPVGVRGRYLGRRLSMMGASELACFITAGFVLNWFAEQVFVGFSIIFAFAAAARLASWFMYLKMKDVPLARREEISHFGFHDVGQAVKNGSIGKFMLFTSTFYFAVFLASPFYAVLMLTELGFSYVAFMVVICSDQLTRLVVLHFWGKYADRNGSLRVIKYVSAVLPLTPLMWLVSQNVVYLVLVQITAGIAWAGFELCAPNFIYGGAPQGSRIKYIALFRALNGVGAAGGALVGGYLATILPPLFGQQILSLFLLSGIIRGIVVLRFLPSIIDITLKGRNKPAWGSLRPKGLMAADAVTDGFGWGLLYIPENMRRDLRKAFQPAFPQDKTDAPKQGSLLQRWARFALRQKNDTEPVLVYVDTHEDLRRQVLRRRAINEQTAAQARAAKKNDENTVGLGTRLVKVLKSRFGVDAPAGKAKEDTKVSLLHNNQLGKKMMEAVQERQNMQAQTASRAARNETHHKLAQHAIRQLAEKNNTAANSAGVKQQSRTGLLRNGLDTAAHKKSEAGVEVERSGKLIAGNKRDGLLYREGAWQSYQKNASSSGNVTAMGMVSKPLVRHGLFNNAEAWASYVQKDQKSSVKSGPMDKLASMKRPGELVAKTGPMNRLRANL